MLHEEEESAFCVFSSIGRQVSASLALQYAQSILRLLTDFVLHITARAITWFSSMVCEGGLRPAFRLCGALSYSPLSCFPED